MSKKIVLLSSGQPSLNPRLVKEADALTEAGYKVVVIYLFWNSWGTLLDEDLLVSKKWKAIRVAGAPHQNKAVFKISKLIQRIAKAIPFRIGKKLIIPELAISRGSIFLYGEAIKHNADLYIGHNMGALAPTVRAAKVKGKLCGFDAEDFHRNEVSDEPAHPDVQMKEYLEEKYFPRLDYLSAASPLIAEEYKKHFNSLHITSILNVFPLANIPPAKSKAQSEPLRLFWFSQTIGKDRGLEDIFEALGKAKDLSIELHLLGDLREQDKIHFELLTKIHDIDPAIIFFYPPIPSAEVIPFASQFDIGLATETGKPYNREICLTNKIFTYMSAGLASIASNTKAQTRLLSDNPGTGLVYTRGNIDELADLLSYYSLNKESLIAARAASLAYSKTELNWDHEQHKFLHLINTLLCN